MDAENIVVSYYVVAFSWKGTKKMKENSQLKEGSFQKDTVFLNYGTLLEWLF